MFAADWRLIWWNRGWAALIGDPSALAPEDRNLVRSRFPVATVGEVTMDCGVLNDSDTDLKIVIYTVAPGGEDESKLDLTRVAGPARQVVAADPGTGSGTGLHGPP